MIYPRSNFNRFWTFDAGANVLNEVSVPNGCGPGFPGYEFAPDDGGVIISTAGTDTAIGIYAGNTRVGGSASWYLLGSSSGYTNVPWCLPNQHRPVKFRSR